jgi:hypothetical protein
MEIQPPRPQRKAARRPLQQQEKPHEEHEVLQASSLNSATVAFHFAISASRRLSKHASNNNVTQLNKVKLCKQKQPKSSA